MHLLCSQGLQRDKRVSESLEIPNLTLSATPEALVKCCILNEDWQGSKGRVSGSGLLDHRLWQLSALTYGVQSSRTSKIGRALKGKLSCFPWRAAWQVNIGD